MQYVIDICLLLLLAVVLFQDLKQRQISWFLIPLLLVFFIAQGLFRIPANELIHYTMFNIGFIVVQLVILTVYISIKNKKLVNIINSYLGIGDVLFIATVAAAFSPFNFIIFYIAALLFTLLVFLMVTLLTKNLSKEIPLAGAMAAVIMVLIIVNQWLPVFNFYNDDYLTGWFGKIF
ncbi:MAG: hypothetical protein V4511_15450 [Bacteroidota bacterium]